MQLFDDADLARFMWWTTRQMKSGSHRDAGAVIARLFCYQRDINPDEIEADVVQRGWEPAHA